MENYKIYYKKLDDNIDQKNIESILPKSIVDHCKAYKEKEAYLQSLYAWFSLYQTFKNEYGYSLNDEVINFNKPKPYLKNNDYYFNISHSYDGISYIISRSECGIDIQREFDNERVAKKILNDEEYNEYKTSSNSKEYLNYKWVMKEAYGKYLAKGVDASILREKINTDNKKTITLSDTRYYLSWFVKE